MDNQLVPLLTGKPDHPVLIYLLSLSEGSRRTMYGALNTIAEVVCVSCDAMSFRWASLSRDQILAIRAVLAKRYAPSTANRMLSALRQVLKECWRLGLMDAEAYRKISDIPPIPGQRPLAGRHVTNGELKGLLEVCASDTTPAGVRDAALIAVLYTTGIRRASVAHLLLADYEADTGDLAVQRAKGNKALRTYIEDEATRQWLDDWIAVRGDSPGALFCPVLKSQRIVIRRLSEQAIYDIVRRKADEANLASTSPHDFRRTFVGELLDAGVDLSTVQQLAGHASPVTTARYDRRPEETKRRAVRTLRVPSRPKNRSRADQP